MVLFGKFFSFLVEFKYFQEKTMAKNPPREIFYLNISLKKWVQCMFYYAASILMY